MSKQLDHFIASKAEIDRMLGRLQKASDDHFGRNPELISWGDCGDLGHYKRLLQEVSDQVFQEGEYAK